MRIPFLTTVALFIAATISAAPASPDVGTHKTAMQKLSFLVGNWRGDATLMGHEGKETKIIQTEQVEYRLDGSIMIIEGTGRNEAGRVLFNAFAVISYDAPTEKYRIRAWSGGNFIETEFKVGDKIFEWGFNQGPAAVVHRMSLDAKGKWSETSEIKLPDGKSFTSLRMLLSRQ